MWRTYNGRYPCYGGEFSLGGQGNSKVGHRPLVFQDMVVLIC